jgi:hypothetical protein
MASLAMPHEVATAQERHLSSAEAEYPEPFDLISGFRALPDGRVLVSDGIGEVLVAVDITRGVADTLGRKGKGPGEYTMPDRLFALPDGRTLLLDLGNGRMTTVEADGTFGKSRSIAQDDGAGFSIIMPRASDAAGNLYYQPMGGGPGRQRPDSAAVVRWSPDGAASDTVAQVKLQEVKIETSGSANNRNVSMRLVPYSPQGSWAVAGDGRIALARSGSEYRLDWVSPEGRLVRGTPVSYRPVKIGKAEKEEFVENRGNGLAIMVDMDNGRRSVSFGRGGSMGPPPSVDEYDWPDTKPPFPASAVTVAPDGNAWVRRSTKAGEPQRFDVFDATGNRTGEVVLPAQRRLLGFGDGVVYLAYVDEDDLQWLERYDL